MLGVCKLTGSLGIAGALESWEMQDHDMKKIYSLQCAMGYLYLFNSSTRPLHMHLGDEAGSDSFHQMPTGVGLRKVWRSLGWESLQRARLAVRSCHLSSFPVTSFCQRAGLGEKHWEFLKMCWFQPGQPQRCLQDPLPEHTLPSPRRRGHHL